MNNDKRCIVCGVSYPIGTRKPSQYAKSKFCSLACSGKHQQGNVADLISRIEVNPETGCWIWTGKKIQKGYGQTRIGGRMTLVHRAVYEHHKGPIPEGLQLDHLCAVKACCNPEHLRAVTAHVNILADTCNNMAARWSRRLACDQCGGPFSQFPNGLRYCKPCRNEKMMVAQRLRRAAKKNPAPIVPDGAVDANPPTGEPEKENSK